MGKFKKLYLLSGLLILSAFQAHSQDENSQDENPLEVYTVRYITPDNRVESYLEIRDSALAVIDVLKEKWGEDNENNGKIVWNNVQIDTIQGKINVTMLYGISKGEYVPFKVCPIPQKEKKDDKHFLRFRFMQKDKDLLSASDTAEILKKYLLEILESLGSEGNEDKE
jgi:hypothetical protein